MTVSYLLGGEILRSVCHVRKVARDAAATATPVLTEAPIFFSMCLRQ